MAKHLITGATGEELAVNFLLQKGYQIIHTNWRHKNLEIDIIASINSMVVFVEVKTRTTADFGEPYESINAAKHNRLLRAAEHYLETLAGDAECRFDAVSITLKPSPVIQHFEQIF